MKTNPARFRAAAFVALALVAVGSTGCQDETIISQLVDCGLERFDLTGTWNIQFTPDTAAFFNCSTTGSVTVDDSVFPFTDITVFASASNVGFQFLDSADPNIVTGNAEADSCLMLLSFLDPNEDVYLQCFGTFDRATGTMQGACDSATIMDFTVPTVPVVLDDCDLDQVLFMSLAITP